MNYAERFEQVAKWAAEREKKAAQALAMATSKLQEANTQLEALYRFRAEYLSRMQQDGAAVTALQFQQLRAFLNRLGSAIAEQEAVLQKLRQEIAALQAAWQRAYCRRQGIDKIRADRLRRQQAEIERRQQGELDDRAAAKHRARKIKK